MSAGALPPFDGNAYRKRVLAAVDGRGGPEQSDPFEIYDLPVAAVDALSDESVDAQIDAVWAFWQKQRDHPKYRGVVSAMLVIHRDIADQMRSRDGRRWLAEQTVVERVRREEERYAEVDAAVLRLVERFGGIPENKVPGLRRFALAAGVDEAAFDARLRRHLVLRPAGPPAQDGVLRQVRADLDELAQLDGSEPAASLYALLGLPPGAERQRVLARRDALAARNRERRPDRRRALVDDLLAAVTTLLVNGDPDRYLDGVRAEVLSRLRPRVAAAVLVEDELTADDHAHLLAEAQAAGLDQDRAVSVLARLAAELGVPIQVVDPRSPATSVRPSTTAARPGTAWQQELSRARAALRDGLVLAARTHVGAAQAAADGMLPPIRAVRDEVEAILAEADPRWRSAVNAVAARRYAEARETLERLVAVARDVPGPRGASAPDLLATASERLAEADSALSAARSLTGTAQELALLDVLAAVADHEPTRVALAAAGVAPATDVRVVVSHDGARVSWRASASPGSVDYRVLRVAADGSTQPLGVTAATSLEDGAPALAAAYAVVARRAGVAAPEARSGSPAPEARSGSPVLKARSGSAGPEDHAGHAGVDPVGSPAGPVAVAPGEPPTPVPTLVASPYGRRVRLVYPPPTAGRAEVRRLPEGAVPPAPGTWVDDPDRLGVLVPSLGPGLALDAAPSVAICEYVVVTVRGSSVAGASATYVVLPAVHDLEFVDGRLLWTWPAGCTEVVVLCRADAAPVDADDPSAIRRKVTNTRYQIDGGLPLTEPAPLYVAVFACTRRAARLFVATHAPEAARIAIS